MSSDDDAHDDFGPGDDRSKKRRIQRACDTCRRKKIRCDGSQMVDNRCSNCITWNMECTYVEAAKKRGPPKGYVESLENRLEKMEKLLRSLCPDADFTKELGTFIDRETWYHERSANKSGALSSQSGAKLTGREVPPVAGIRPTAHSSTQPPEDDPPNSDDDAFMPAMLAEGLKHLTVNVNDRRFHGKSSGIMLVQAAMDFKREYAGASSDGMSSALSDSRREEFWIPRDWETSAFEDIQVPLEFPDDDLVRSLFDIFFEYVNPFYPIHHRPSLSRNYQSGLHHSDRVFAATLLLTCAAAARWSDDPRVFVDPNTKHSAGWGMFEQAQGLRRNALATPTLFDVQVYTLSAIFLTGSSAPQAAWTIIGIGIRLAQDVGAHRRKVYNAATTVEDEQWKRAFWSLVALDRGISSTLGRPCAIQDEDFDLDHPLEVDDEYWEHLDPSQMFRQPPDRPPRVAYFNCFLKLNQILAFALRTIYSINKSKILLGFVGPQWEQHIVAELDSALNKWIDSVPDHLRWDPNREDPLFFAQSVTLYATYYHLQILIHRPFIPTPRKPSPLSFPSLAICTNAARSCSHVLDTARRRMKMPIPTNIAAAFTSGIVLLLNIWGAKKSGMQTDPIKQMMDVHKCMQHLKDVEVRFRAAGRLWDILFELASVGELPLPQPSPPGQSHKRERGSDYPSRTSASGPSSETSGSTSSEPRPIARLPSTARQSDSSRGSHIQKTPTPPLQSGAMYTGPQHPITTASLGKMPLHPGMDYTSQETVAQQWYEIQQQPTVASASYGQPGAMQHGGFQMQMPSDESIFDPSIFPSATDPHSVNQYRAAYGQTQPNPAIHIASYGAAPTSREIDYMGGMWSNAPQSFEYDDWGNFLSSAIDPQTGMLSGIQPNSNPHQ